MGSTTLAERKRSKNEAMATARKYLMHVISGTHWDREWRHTAEQSKPRLVDLIDSMMVTLDKKPEYKTYCLDGGMVVIEDYLTIRPENKQRLKKYIEDGRIQLVNWYTLPESFTVAGEALIRNLKLGQDMAAEYGGAMSSGYTATGYGQTSQLPQIYKGFGIENAIFYRGTNKHLLTPLFHWQSPDGSKIHVLRTFDEVTRTNWFFYVHQPLVADKPARDLTYRYDPKHLPVHMCDEQLYERGFKVLRDVARFSKDKDSLKKALNTIVEQAKPYAVGKHLLALNMEDNDSPFELLPDMIESLNKVSGEVEFVQSSMDEYMQAIIADADIDGDVFHKGELRYPAVEEGFNGLLGATHSSRVKLKILNEDTETCLLYQAEPLATVSSLLGSEYPRAFLDRAWRHLLLNQAHDSICGAAVDQAHEDMLYNFSVASAVGQEITARSSAQLISNIKTSDSFKEGDHTVTFFNNLPFERKKVIKVVIDLPKNAKSDGVVDPCTGVGASESENTDIDYFDIIDSHGKAVDYEILTKEDINIAVERPYDTNGIKMPAVRRKMLVEVSVPAMGYGTYALRPRERRYVAHPQPGPDRPLIARGNGLLENEHIRVQINPNGTFSLLHKATDHLMENLHYFTDRGEVGSAHIDAQTQLNTTQQSLGACSKVTLVESNLLRGIYRIDLEMTIPAGATLDGKYRLREEKKLPITTWLTLEKDSPYLKINTRLTNEARDHKLQVNFPSGIYTDFVDVESTYAVESRSIRYPEAGDNFEQGYPFQPMQNFVDLSDGKVGLAVLNKGLREYEVMDDKQRTIAITLLRTHRAYMTANSDMTPDELDKYTGLQSLDTLEYTYALYPHSGRWNDGDVLRQAYDHKVSFSAIQALPNNQGELPPESSFFKINPSDKLMLSALKQADDGSGVILRLWNTSSDDLTASVKTALPVKSAAMLKLDESLMSDLDFEDGEVKFSCGRHKIITLLLRTA